MKTLHLNAVSFQKDGVEKTLHGIVDKEGEFELLLDETINETVGTVRLNTSDLVNLSEFKRFRMEIFVAKTSVSSLLTTGVNGQSYGYVNMGGVSSFPQLHAFEFYSRYGRFYCECMTKAETSIDYLAQSSATIRIRGYGYDSAKENISYLFATLGGLGGEGFPAGSNIKFYGVRR